MIRFAGYDPTEDDFDGIEPAPLHDDDYRPPGRSRIDIERALALKSAGLPWRRIGEILVADENRPTKYTAGGISGAVYRCTRRELRT